MPPCAKPPPQQYLSAIASLAALVIAPALGLAQTCPGANTLSESVWFNEKNLAFDFHLMETNTDEGSGVYDDMLSNLIANTSWSTISGWVNPITYSNLDVEFAWTDSLQSGETCYADRSVGDEPFSLTYKYRRFSLNGASGIAFFHSNYTGQCPLPGNDKHTAYGFIHNTGTCCDLHEDAILADQEDDGNGEGPENTYCEGQAVSGPKPPTPAIPALLRSFDLDKMIVFVELSGGPGPHSAMTRLQQTLLARKALETNILHSACFDVDKVFLTGGSFGSAVALAAQMIYPAQFDGTFASGNAFVSTDAFFGYERFFSHAQSQIALNGKGLSGGASRISTSDYWTYDQFQRMLKAKNTTGGTFGFNNMSFLDRLAERISNSSGTPALTDPVIIVHGDEDSIAQGSHFRHEFEHLITTNNLPNGGPAYTSLIKVITVPFRDHGNPAGESETIQLNPSLFTDETVQPSSSSSMIDWLIYLAENPPTGLSDPTTPPPFDEGVPEPNSASDYRFENFLFTSPPDDDIGSLLDHAWTIGSGSAPGLNDNMIVANVDGDARLEVIYGDNDGFVHIYEWKNDKLELQWLSPDMGHGVGSIGVGDFKAEGGGTEKGILAISASGEIWAIQTETTPINHHALDAAKLLVGGERELPVLAIGEYTGSVTPVYLVGTSPPNGTPVGDYPNEAKITRVNVSSIYNFSATTAQIVHQEPCEPLTHLQWDADNDELIGTTARGYLYRIEYDSSSGGDFKFLTTIDNFGLGEYLGMTLRQCKKVDLDGTDLYFVVGQSESDPTGSVSDKRNLAAVSDCGVVLDLEHVTNGLNPDALLHDLLCLEVIAIDTDTVRLALGGIDGVRFYDFNYNSTTPTSSTFSEVNYNGTSTPSYWSARRVIDNQTQNEVFGEEKVLSLEYFEDLDLESNFREHLVGTTERGIVFIWELPGGLSNPPAVPTIEDQISPYNGAFGMKVIAHAMNEFEPYETQGEEPPFGCPIDNALTLNLMPRFSYDYTFPALTDPVASKSFAEKVHVDDGSSLCRRARARVGQVLTPDLRLPPLFQAPNPVNFNGQLLYDLFFLDSEEPDLEIHYFLETMDVGETATSGTFDAAYTQSDMDGTLKLRSSYLTNLTTLSDFPSGGSYLLTDRYYVNSQFYAGGVGDDPIYRPVYFGNAVRIGDVIGAETTTPQADDVVMTTIGGRVIVISGGTPSLSWVSNKPYLPGGDFGFHMTGLALYDVDGDGLDEIFAVAGTNSDPNDKENINSHLLIWDTTSSLDLSSPDQRIDLGDIGCFGLWVGPAIGEESDESSGPYDVIVGGSQTFSVYRIDTTQNEWIGSSSFESKGLGTNIGAFNSIRVHRDISGTDVTDYVFVGSSAYYHGYTAEFTISE